MAHHRPVDMKAWLREMRGGLGLLVVGAVIGGGAFFVVDSFQPEEQKARHGVFSLRGPYYASCREAFLDGRANIKRGEPGYRAELDADGDGLACEPYAPLRR